jgi:hypothetical protein
MSILDRIRNTILVFGLCNCVVGIVCAFCFQDLYSVICGYTYYMSIMLYNDL